MSIRRLIDDMKARQLAALREFICRIPEGGLKRRELAPKFFIVSNHEISVIFFDKDEFANVRVFDMKRKVEEVFLTVTIVQALELLQLLKKKAGTEL